MNIDATEELIDRYIDKKNQISDREVKFSHVCICGSIGAIVGMARVKVPALDLMMFASMGGYVVGAMLPYAVKKIKIGELNYQIYMNKGILEGLEKEKKQKIDKVKTLRK